MVTVQVSNSQDKCGAGREGGPDLAYVTTFNHMYKGMRK